MVLSSTSAAPNPQITNPSHIWIDDPDVLTTDSVQVTLELRVDGTTTLASSGTHGSLTLAQTSNLTFIVGTGLGGETKIQFQGVMSDINLALDGLTYSPATNFNGSIDLWIQTNDLGHNGTGTGIDADTVDITVSSVNDAPVIALSGTSPSYTENGDPVTITPTATVTDVDNPTDFDGGRLEIWISNNARVDDQLLIQDSGTPGTGIELSLDGAPIFPTFSVTYDGDVIGTGSGNGFVTVDTDDDNDVKLVIDLEGSDATPSAVKALIESIGFHNLGDNPRGDTRTVRYRLGDGDGNQTTAVGNDYSAEVTRDVTVTPENDLPIILLPSPAINYIEGVGARPIDTAARVIDPDTPILTTAAIWEVQITQGAQTTDALDINHAGTSPGPGQIGIDGTTVKYGSSTIGALGTSPPYTGSTKLLVLFGQNTPIEAIQTFMRLVTYENTSNEPDTTTRVVTFTPREGSSAGPTTNKTILMNSVRDVPQITFSSSTAVDYTENDPATLLVTSPVTVTLTDADTPNYAGGTLTVDVTSGQDVLNRAYVLTGGSITVSGTDVQYSGSSIGTLSNTSGTLPLIVTLSGNATHDALEALISQVAYFSYSNVFPKDSQTTKTVTYTLVEPDGLLSGSVTRDIQILGLNDAPDIDDAQFPSLPPANQDETDPRGRSISSMVGVGIYDADQGAQKGVVVIETTLLGGLTGDWQFRRATGTWEDLEGGASLSTSRARALYDSAYVRFVPDPGKSGEARITVLAWDRTDGTPDGGLIDIPGLGGGTYAVGHVQGVEELIIANINAKPQITPTTASINYTENAGPQFPALGSNLDITDNGSTLTAARVWIDDFEPGNEALGFTSTSTIYGYWDRLEGELKLTGSDSITDYLIELNKITYEYSGEDPPTSRTLHLTVSDGSVEADPVLRTVNIAVDDDQPTIYGMPDIAVLATKETVIDLRDYAVDPDTPIENLTFSVSSNNAAVTPTLESGHLLKITSTTAGIGLDPSPIITVEVSDATPFVTAEGTDTFSVDVNASVVYVDNGSSPDPSDTPLYTTIADGIAGAVSILDDPTLDTSDTTVKVVVRPGTTDYTDTDLDFGGKTIILEGDPNDPDSVIINPGSVQGNRTFTLTDAPSGSIIDGFTLTGGLVTGNGLAGQGGAIYIGPNASPTLQNLVITGNTAREGGGIYISDGSAAVILDCLIKENAAHERGGGIFGFAGSPAQVRQSVIRNNTAADGAGIYAE